VRVIDGKASVSTASVLQWLGTTDYSEDWTEANVEKFVQHANSKLDRITIYPSEAVIAKSEYEPLTVLDSTTRILNSQLMNRVFGKNLIRLCGAVRRSFFSNNGKSI